jgi:hypothetical protein
VQPQSPQYGSGSSSLSCWEQQEILTFLQQEESCSSCPEIELQASVAPDAELTTQQQSGMVNASTIAIMFVKRL